MSKRSKDPGKALKGKPQYDVGYAKPPEETRFKPGQSGNPRGRPKGAKNKRPGMHEERMKDIILDEAYRDITIREGERNVTIPLVQAVMRSMGVNAVKGHARAQRLFAELLASVESSRKMLNDRWLETAIEYKVNWERELSRRKGLGITGLPEPLPHPDHVEIDLDEGTARIIGPRTKEEKAALDQILAQRNDLIDELYDIDSARNAASDPRERQRLSRLRDKKLEFLRFINRIAPRQDEE